MCVGVVAGRCFRLAVALEGCRRQTENYRSVQLGERGLNEAFTPSAAKRKLFVERLPARTPTFGTDEFVSLFWKASNRHAGGELQRVESWHAHGRTGDRDKRFRIERIFFASGLNRECLPDTDFVLKAVFVIRIFESKFPE